MHRICLKLIYELSEMYGKDEANDPAEFPAFTLYYEVGAPFSEMQGKEGPLRADYER